MLDESHLVVFLTSAHGLNTRAEAGDGQNNNVADLLRRLHAGEVLPCDVALAGAHVEVVRVVEVVENAVGPDRGASKLDYTLVVLAELACLLAAQCLLCNICNHVNEDGVARLRLNCPLAELNAAGVPLSPVWTIWVGFDTNNHAVGAGWHILGYPIGCALQRRRVNV